MLKLAAPKEIPKEFIKIAYKLHPKF